MLSVLGVRTPKVDNGPNSPRFHVLNLLFFQRPLLPCAKEKPSKATPTSERRTMSNRLRTPALRLRRSQMIVGPSPIAEQPLRMYVVLLVSCLSAIGMVCPRTKYCTGATNCFTPSGGGPNPNDCTVIADALLFESQNKGDPVSPSLFRSISNLMFIISIGDDFTLNPAVRLIIYHVRFWKAHADCVFVIIRLTRLS